MSPLHTEVDFARPSNIKVHLTSPFVCKVRKILIDIFARGLKLLKQIQSS